MTIGPAPKIIIVLMSVRFLTAAPVFHASKGGGTLATFSGAATARTSCAFLSRLPLLLPAKQTVGCLCPAALPAALLC
jgi:hypothetical protein